MLDFNREYQLALELASTMRYKEAGEKLKSILLEQPDNTAALILLGKVEYYLRLFPSSRRRFETALTYSPGNFEAYYGLQFFNERKKRLAIISAWTATVFLIILMVFFLNISIENRLNGLEVMVEGQFESSYTVGTRMLNEILALSDTLAQHIHEVKEMKEVTEALLEKHSEKIYNLELKQEFHFEKLKDNQLESLKTITSEINDLKEIVEGITVDDSAAKSD